MGDVTVSLLGGFAAEVDGVAVPASAWRLKKARELVKLLALAPGHRLHREQAMDVLWRDLAPAAAANNLHQAVHVARRTLAAEAIELREEVLSLNVEIDVDRFELAAADARRVKTTTAYRAAHLALQRRAPAREPLRRLGGRAARRALDPRSRARGGVGRARGLGAVRAARRRKLVHRPGPGADRAPVSAPPHSPPHPRRDGRRGQDTARARARPGRRELLRGGRRTGRTGRAHGCTAGPRSDRGCARHPRAAGSGPRRCDHRRSCHREHCCSCWTTASTCWRTRSSSATGCCASHRS